MNPGDLTHEQAYQRERARLAVGGLAALVAMLLLAGWRRSKSDED